MKDAIPVLTFVLILLILQIIYVELYSLKCPSNANWKIRAKSKCNSTFKYYCLYNNLQRRYVEGCEGPDWDRKGSKRIFSVSFTRGICTQKRYQPFKFQTNDSMSDCIYSKSLCNEEGQIVYKDDSSKNDRTCRCNYARNYSFIKIPKHVCYCLPSKEDCSCYIKSCPVNLTLTADYNCSSNTNNEKQKCIETTSNSNTKDEETKVNMDKYNFWRNNISATTRINDTPAFLILIYLCFMCLCAFTISSKWFREKLKPLKHCFEIDEDHKEVQTTKSGFLFNETVYDSCEEDTDSFKSIKEKADVEVDTPVTFAERGTDEENYLRIIHLLFRVACPVIRMIFNIEVQPNQLRKHLNKKKELMEKKYRKKGKKINDFQWNLLYGFAKGKVVTSDVFDIKLMLNLLDALANMEIGDLYPIQSDKSISAMLSRIKFIRNEATQSFEGKLSKDQFNKYWDDIAQAVFILVPLHCKVDSLEKKQLISRLYTMNPIDMDSDNLCKYIDLSDIYPAKILHQIIIEYCTSNGQTIENILRNEKHELYHKRIKTESCCVCSDKQFSIYMKVIQEKQWETLYEMKQDAISHYCQSNIQKCCERFIPKRLDTYDLSVALTLVLYIPDMLTYIINRLYTNKFDMFLKKNKHTLYHSMTTERCCSCNNVPTGKVLLSKKEWNKIFRKTDDLMRQTCTNDCCCKFKVIHGIKSSDMDENLLSKICHVAGPMSILNKIVQDSFLYFLNWNADKRPLRDALTELLNIIGDRTLPREMSKHVLSCNSQLDKTITEAVDVQKWVSTHIKREHTAPEPALQFLLSNKDSFIVHSVNIPADFSLPNRTRHFEDLTDEENNFLAIVHALNTIVYPLIQDEFNKQCRDNELEKIRTAIYEQPTRCSRDSHSERNISQWTNIYLTQKQKEQLFSPIKEESRNLDLKLMIYILIIKKEEEGKKDYVEQLEVINTIRRDIFQSSSGVLNEGKFKEILKLTTKAIAHFGEEIYGERIELLHHVRNNIEL